jgi:hypothetical protein
MAGPMYFQWQNEVLLKTIYPLREMKLRDFLVYYSAICLRARCQPVISMKCWIGIISCSNHSCRRPKWTRIGRTIFNGRSMLMAGNLVTL